MSDNIVVDWLKSIKLELYTDAFLDNGYDELEVCKQIGEADLDAIGVHNGVHREILLNAVTRLREEGGASVYFTLEEPEDYDQTDDEKRDLSKSSNKGSNRHGALKGTPPEPPPPNLEQLRNFINDKLRRDGVDLTGPPYTKQDNACCTSSLTALSVKYAGHLKAHLQDVYKCLEELWVWRTRKAAQLYYSATVVNAAATKKALAGSSVFNSGAAVPPPIPSSLPPSTSHAEKTVDLHSVHTRYTYDNSGFQADPSQENQENKDADRKKTSTLGRFFRNLGLRKSGKKHSYKPHNGDPNAYEITMDDEDRMALMLLVKEGKITTDHALQVVKRYEEEKRREFQLYEKERKLLMKKQKKKPQPVKSPSATYNDYSRHCDVCQGLVSCDISQNTSGNVCSDPSHRFECHQHRRVHSVGHIDYAYSPRSPEATRSLSCTPTHCLVSHHGSGISTPVSFYSPGHNPRIYSPVMLQEQRIYGYCGSCCHYSRGGVMLPGSASSQGRASRCDIMSPQGSVAGRCELSPSGGGVSRSGSGCADHSPSTTSFDLVSSESDHSIDSHLHPNQASRRSNGINNLDSSSAIFTHRDPNCPQHSLQSMWQSSHVNNADVKTNQDLVEPSMSASSVESNHSAESSGLCSFHSASPGVSTPLMEDMMDSHMNFVRAVTDFQPNPSNMDMLRLQKGDIIRVTNKPPGEVWGGMLKGKTGWFKVACVEPYVTSDTAQSAKVRRSDSKSRKPQSVKEILHLIGLENLEPLFMQNGFDQPDCFLDLEDSDLDSLGIFDSQLRSRLLAVGDMMCSTDGFSMKNIQARKAPAAFINREYRYGNHSYPASQDSGCYASFEHLAHRDCCQTSQSPVVNSRRESQCCVHSNKENTNPNLHVGVYTTNGVPDSKADRDTTEVNDLDKTDKDLTAEDQEVFEITRNSLEREHLKSNSSPTADTKVQGHVSGSVDQSSGKSYPIVMCSYAGTQTSPSYGSVCDTKAHKRSSNMSSLSKDNDLHNASVPQPKPFPRKCVPRNELSFRDVQVQVMSPMGMTPVRADAAVNRNSLDSQSTVNHSNSVKNMFIENHSMSPSGLISRGDNSPTCRMSYNSQVSSGHFSCGHRPMKENHIVSPLANTVRGENFGPMASPYSSVRPGNIVQGENMGPIASPYSCVSPGSIVRGENMVPMVQPCSSVSPYSQAGYRSVNRRSRSVDSAQHSHPPEYRTVMRSLINLVTTKLVAENIDLSMEPYSSKMGECGIPPLLVQRYAEELKQDLVSVALVIDQVRVQKLCARHRPGILSRDLPELAGRACDIKIGSVPEFFTSIGLPMYSDIFLNQDYNSVEELCKLNIETIRDITRTHNKHVKRIFHALDWVQNRFTSMRKSTSSKDAALMDRV